jgi:hypothetical protein
MHFLRESFKTEKHALTHLVMHQQLTIGVAFFMGRNVLRVFRPANAAERQSVCASTLPSGVGWFAASSQELKNLNGAMESIFYRAKKARRVHEVH